MTAAVYVVGGTRDHEELRYSLRSLATNAPDVTQVWIVGEVPEWVKGARRLPLAQRPRKYPDFRNKLATFCSTKGTPPRFYLMNEDHYVHRPVEGELPTYHLGDARAYMKKVWTPRNAWCTAVANALTHVERTVSTPLGYLAHTPLLFDRAALAAELEKVPAYTEVSVQTLYPIAGAGGEGVNAGNAKVAPHDDLDAKLAQDMPFTSGNARSFAGAHGDYVRALFPEPCKWER